MKWVKLVSNQWVLSIECSLIKSYSSIQVIQNMFKKTWMFRIRLAAKIFLIYFLWNFLKIFLLKLLTPITNSIRTLLSKFSIKDKNNKFMANQILMPHNINLLILPLYQWRIIFSFLHIISLQLDKILNFFHTITNIISLWNIHAETKYLKITLWLNLYLLRFSSYFVNTHLYLLISFWCYF